MCALRLTSVCPFGYYSLDVSMDSPPGSPPREKLGKWGFGRRERGKISETGTTKGPVQRDAYMGDTAGGNVSRACDTS